jgi:hypothetical protein
VRLVAYYQAPDISKGARGRCSSAGPSFAPNAKPLWRRVRGEESGLMNEFEHTLMSKLASKDMTLSDLAERIWGKDKQTGDLSSGEPIVYSPTSVRELP